MIYATGALKEDLDRNLSGIREAVAQEGGGPIAVLVLHASNPAENGPWEWDEATGEWFRPEADGSCVAVLEDR